MGYALERDLSEYANFTKHTFCSVAQLCDRLTDLTNVFTSLEVGFLGEVVNCLFEAHTKRRSAEQNKHSAGLEKRCSDGGLEQQN